MGADRAKALAGDVFVLAAHDVQDRQGKQALRGLLEGGIEDILDAVPQQDSGRPRRAGPDHEQNPSKRQEEPAL
ncbi:hypothetical protein GCM10007881_63170 [Mesorhizobium huakuii]|nr:hypothetical protein GCM10007881_63170 [Mesorhizobium huakuii]